MVLQNGQTPAKRRHTPKLKKTLFFKGYTKEILQLLIIKQRSIVVTPMKGYEYNMLKKWEEYRRCTTAENFLDFVSNWSTLIRPWARALTSSQEIPSIIQSVELQTNLRGLKKKQEGADFEVFDACSAPPTPHTLGQKNLKKKKRRNLT